MQFKLKIRLLIKVFFLRCYTIIDVLTFHLLIHYLKFNFINMPLKVKNLSKKFILDKNYDQYTLNEILYII
jgi:hypothetical protein